MTSSEPDSERFEALSRELLEKGITVRFEARGASMSPTIRDGETVHVTPVIITKLRKGDIVLTKGDKQFLIHRLVVANHDENVFITRGDCSQQDDPPVGRAQILGLAVAKELRLGKRIVRMKLTGCSGKVLLGYERGRSLAGTILRKVGLRRSSSGSRKLPPGSNLFALIAVLLLLSGHSPAQVAVDTDPSTSTSADLTGPGTQTLTFDHTTSTTADRALLVGVSMDIANSPAAAVTGITYNGTALTLIGAQNDSSNTRRIEQWYLLNPSSGTNLPIIVSVSVPTAATIGVVAGATVFTDVDQNVPLGTFVSGSAEEAACIASTATGDYQCNSGVTVSSVVNGMVFDTLAVGVGTITVEGPQVQQWNVTSGTPIASEDIIGTASTRSGAPSVPVAEYFNNALTLTSVAPTTVALTLTAAAAAAGGDTVYTGTITGGAGNAYVGDSVTVAGFTNGDDNGTFTCTASTATTITLNNADGVAQTHAGTATVTTGTVYTGTITGGSGNGYVGDSFVIAGFTDAADNGTFTATASTATTLTVNNTAGVAQTHAATATTNNTFNWAQGAISVNPSVADIGVTTSVGSAVFLGQSTTYTITVYNNGTSGAIGVTLSDQLAAGMTLNSVTTTAGTCNSSGNPVTCNLGNMNSGANVTVTVVETATTSGAYANTASVTDSATSPPDPNTGNNSFTAVATVQSPSCANVSQASPASSPLTGVINTYYPGTASTAAGATTITLGAATGGPGGTPTAIATGNLLLVIQMQDASISTLDTVAYGNNSTGQGFTALNNAGNYEFVTAASAVPVTGGTLTLTGSGAGGGLVFGYDATAATGTKGQATYQVILVPQYTTATLATTGLTAEAWNGSTGGVLALDTSDTLTLNGATVVMDGMGFRGGAGLQMSGVPATPPPTAPTSTDFQQPAPATYTGTAVGSTGDGEAGWDGSKGEGVAGTPAWLEESVSGTLEPVSTGTGYPSGAYGTFNVTSVANAAGGKTVYTGTFTGGGGNALSGYTFVIGGFANAANNGRFVSSASTATTITVNNTAGVAQTGTATASMDGSMARGAPANAGGGGTDGDPDTTTAAGNDQNDGGGGGGNGGAGGFGGDSWSTDLSSGGEGGAAFPATVNRVAMGGGGGAGTRNNSNGDTQASSGSAGGGIIIIRTFGLSGTATFTANGVNAYNDTANDGGGGAGAGGSIVILSANGGESGLTLEANGGIGGDAWGAEPFTVGNRHGPGGGGGGGVLIVSGAPASASVNGGVNGTTETPGVSYGATSGATGTTVTNATITETSGTQSGAECTPDMTIAKAEAGTFVRGDTNSVSYTLTASNVSPYGPTSGTVTVNDTLPSGIVPSSASGTGWTCSVVSETISCTDSTVLAGASSYPPITVTASVLQTAPSTVSNYGVVGGGGEVNLANDISNTVTATVTSSADLSMANTASPNPVAAGSNITYSQIVTNNGPSAADNATLTETIPANTTFVSITAPSGWSCATPSVGGTGNISCTNVTLAGSTAATFSLVVKVAAGTASGTVITDTATASSSTSDPNSANNTATASTVVGTTTLGEMTVTNSASPDPVIAGDDITYTQTATNTGTGTATNPTLTESTPANTVFESITPPTGTTCTTPPVGGTGTITCTAPTAPAGTSGTVVVVVQVNAGTASGTIITDTATVNSSNQAFGANAATATDVVATSTQADLALATSATPLTLIAGNDITYTQTVTNNGPAAATSVTFTEAVPANTTFVSVSAPVGWSCTETTSVVCTDASLAPSASADIIVVVNVAPSVAAGTITANSSVSSSTSDPYLANNSTTINTPLIVDCDLGVTDSGTPSPATAGSDIVYTQTVTNGGPSSCSNGTFTEATPANTTFVSVSATTAGGGTWTCPNSAPISCTNPSVVPGSVGTITATYQVNAGTAAGTIISDTVTGSTTSSDTNSSNNTATVNIGVAVTGDADLSLTNAGTPTPVDAGQDITFAQTVTNNGPSSASTVTLTETLPANTTFVSLTGPGGAWTCTNTAPYKCTDATVAAPSTANFTFVVQVNPTVTVGTAITDTASVASSVTTDPNPGNNTASSTVYVADSANLSVTNSNTPVPVEAGNNITYTQVVTNSGPSAAANATFTETTPADTTFFSLTTVPTGWSCTLPAVGSAGTISCTDTSLAVGTASFPVVLKVTAGTAAGTTISDVVAVSTTTSDPNTSNNTATANDVVATATESDLVVTNTATPTSVAAGSNVTYTQSVTNDGPAVANAGATFTETTPPNTTFQSVTPPAGWTCTSPAVGGTGTIKCTAAATMAVNATANFTVVLQVVSGTPSGTNIAETATATVGNIVPSLTTNSATANVIVANANSADMAIVKSASPSPTVPDGDILTYTLAVTNNGPATATDVTVIDTLPSDVTYLSAVPTQGTCSEADGTVTCQLGTMNDAGTATVTILTLAGSPGTATNTATVSAAQTDPNPANNTSTQVETITASTEIQLHAMVAAMVKDKTGANRPALFWKTGAESHNLGFNVYREENGRRVKLNPSLIAGSALIMRGSLPKHSGKTYAWIDFSSQSADGVYWLEDVDVNGTRVMHGPLTLAAGKALSPDTAPATSLMLNEINQAQAAKNESSHPVESARRDFRVTASQREKQFEIAANPAIKLFVQHEGWYSVTQPELIQAGLDPNVDPAMLHLYAEAIEQPIQISGAPSGPGGFGPQASIQFYGTGTDSPYTGTRVYWLVEEKTPGLRIPQLPTSAGSNQPPASFPTTVALTPHTTYFSGLITRNGNNFFGALVSTTPVDQTMNTANFDQNSTSLAELEVILQGVILDFPHDVTISLNGTSLGDLTFSGQDQGTFRASVPPGVLLNGENTVTLTAQDGEYDMSLVQTISIRYPHTFVADSDGLKFSGQAGEELQVGGFSRVPAMVLDITDPIRPVQLTPQITSSGASGSTLYQLQVQVPWSTTNPLAPDRHKLIALAANRIDSVGGITPNHPTQWHSRQKGSEIVMISPAQFAESLKPLAQEHEAGGKSTALVFIDDLYDEFTFGEHSPYAIRDFLYAATKAWRTPPHYMLLNGRASLDPRNYLGFGFLDFVPTKIVSATGMMTASDDWFSDFNNTGMPAVATGRLPVSTAAEAALVDGRIAAYESQSSSGAWTSRALMVADVNDMENFSQDSRIVQSALPAAIHPIDVFAANMSISQAQQDILDGINAGELLVNYTGHGSEEEWSGDDLFNDTAASGLTNGSSLPVFLIMDCLNGFFQDVYQEPLAVVLMLAPDGGAVAVLASSGLNQPNPQTKFDRLIVQNAFNPPYPALGDAIVSAKSGISDIAVRKTFNLLGDPAMQVKRPASEQLKPAQP
jgi:uncharacterized repeat protein (TIGR01451 family)